MNFGFDEQQELLRREARKFLDEQCPLEAVRALVQTPDGHSPEIWKQLGELGWLGLVLPESAGGSGLGFVDLMVLLEETGRSLFPGPLVSTTLVGTAIADGGDAAQRERWLPGLVDGSRIAAVAFVDDPRRPEPAGITLEAERDGDGWVLQGTRAFVADAGRADVFALAFRADGELAIGIVEGDAAGLRVEATPTVDATRPIGTVHLEGVRVDAGALLRERHPEALATLTFDRGAAASVAETIGCAEGLLDITVQYAKDRIQFGSPIGRYQGVKHPLAEAYVDIECMKSLGYYAAWALDESPDEVAYSVARAKGYASEAITRIGVTGIQLHGAVGYTEEYDCQLYLKRTKALRPTYGDEDHHYERSAALGGL